MRPNDPTADFAGVTCRKETDAALLCIIDGEEVWIPKSHVHESSTVQAEDDEGTLIISEWIAAQKKLI